MTAVIAVEHSRHLRTPPPRRRAVAVSAVVLGHLSLLLLVWQEKFSTPQGSEVRRSIAIRLVPQRPQRPEAERKMPQIVAVQPLRRAPALSADVDTPRSSILVPVPFAAEAVGSTGGAGATAQAGAGAAAPGHAASGVPLALTPSREVLRGALANPATSDPRSNSPKPTFEERIAMGLDPDLCIKLERLPDGTVRRSLSRLANAESLLQSSHGVGAMGARVCQ